MATTTHETGRRVALGEIRVPDNVRALRGSLAYLNSAACARARRFHASSAVTFRARRVSWE
jgi:hypothetical protein